MGNSTDIYIYFFLILMNDTKRVRSEVVSYSEFDVYVSIGQ